MSSSVVSAKLLVVAVIHEPGGYIAADNFNIVTTASREVNRVLIGSLKGK